MREKLSFGGRVPWAVGLLLAITVVASLTVAFGDRHAGSVFELTSLVPYEVLRGQVWRLATWGFIEPSPIGLIFGCLFLYWFGGDLAGEWGSARFLRVYGAIMLVASLATCLIACVDPAVMAGRYLGGYAMSAAVVVAWGLWFPDRVVRIWFVLPIRGYALAWLTVAITVVLAVYRGWEGYMPELTAEGAMLAWLFRATLFGRLRKLRGQAKQQRRSRKRSASVASLRLVERNDDADVELPKDVSAKLDSLLGKRKKGTE